MTKNKIDKTNCCVFGSNTCRKNEPEACFYLFPRCGVKAKYVFIENVFDSKDRVEKKKTRVIHILKLCIYIGRLLKVQLRPLKTQTL
jgi:hypothetical protein